LALGEKLLLVMNCLQAKIGCNGGTSRVRIHAARRVNVKTIFTLNETQGGTLRGMHEYCSVVVGIHGEATTRGDTIGDTQDISQSMFVGEYLNTRPVAGLGGGNVPPWVSMSRRQGSHEHSWHTWMWAGQGCE
jgi:hypothetical protein